MTTFLVTTKADTGADDVSAMLNAPNHPPTLVVEVPENARLRYRISYSRLAYDLLKECGLGTQDAADFQRILNVLAGLDYELVKCVEEHTASVSKNTQEQP